MDVLAKSTYKRSYHCMTKYTNKEFAMTLHNMAAAILHNHPYISSSDMIVGTILIALMLMHSARPAYSGVHKVSYISRIPNYK